MNIFDAYMMGYMEKTAAPKPEKMGDLRKRLYNWRSGSNSDEEYERRQAMSDALVDEEEKARERQKEVDNELSKADFISKIYNKNAPMIEASRKRRIEAKPIIDARVSKYKNKPMVNKFQNPDMTPDERDTGNAFIDRTYQPRPGKGRLFDRAFTYTPEDVKAWGKAAKENKGTEWEAYRNKLMKENPEAYKRVFGKLENPGSIKPEDIQAMKNEGLTINVADPNVMTRPGATQTVPLHPSLASAADAPASMIQTAPMDYARGTIAAHETGHAMDPILQVPGKIGTPPLPKDKFTFVSDTLANKRTVPQSREAEIPAMVIENAYNMRNNKGITGSGQELEKKLNTYQGSVKPTNLSQMIDYAKYPRIEKSLTNETDPSYLPWQQKHILRYGPQFTGQNDFAKIRPWMEKIRGVDTEPGQPRNRLANMYNKQYMDFLYDKHVRPRYEMRRDNGVIK